MAEETYGFDQARVRLEEIAAQVKRKDTSLEKSLDLLEEGVRLANQCTEQIDHTQWRSVVEVPAEADGAPPAEPGSAEDASAGEGAVAEAEGDGAAAIGGEDDGEADDAADPAEPAGAPPYDQATDL